MSDSITVPMPPRVSWGLLALNAGVWAAVGPTFSSRWDAEHAAVDYRHDHTSAIVRVVEVAPLGPDD